MKTFQKIFTSNLTWLEKVHSQTPSPEQKKLVPGHTLWKIQSLECSVNQKIPKNLVSPKKVGAIKKFLKSFDLKFSMSKKI